MSSKLEAETPTAGLLLAGGRSRRMGGKDKPFLALAGATLLDRAIAALRPQCDALLISANGDPARFALRGLPVVPDSVPGFAGPLPGILAGLEFAAAYLPEVQHVVSVATDTPFLPADLVARLHQARIAADATLACAASGGRSHWAIALWPVALRDAMRCALVQEDLRKIERFIERYACATAEWPVRPFDPFFNINEPEDLATAERLAAAIDASGER